SLTVLLGNQRGCNDVTGPIRGDEGPGQAVTGRAGLIATGNLGTRAQLVEHLPQGLPFVWHRSDHPCRLPAELGDRDDDRVLVHIQTDEPSFDTLSHGPVLPLLALSRSPQAFRITHVTRDRLVQPSSTRRLDSTPPQRSGHRSRALDV